MRHLKKLASPCLKISNVALFLSAFIGMSFVGCGQTASEKDYKFEKERRKETEQILTQSQDDASQLKYFLTSIQTTPHYVWIYRENMSVYDEARGDYNEAVEACQELGFELPTMDMAAEAATNPELKKVLFYPENGGKNFVTVDQPAGTLTLLLVCAKKI
jgi:hypothetical protein